jgi:hypothetical protein
VYVTAVLIIFGGLVRVMNYAVSEWIILAAFTLYVGMRLRFYFCCRRRKWSPVELQRFIVLAILFTMVALNIVTLWGILTSYRSEFLPFILLMTDYLLTVNGGRGTGNGDKRTTA